MQKYDREKILFEYGELVYIKKAGNLKPIRSYNARFITNLIAASRLYQGIAINQTFNQRKVTPWAFYPKEKRFIYNQGPFA